MTFECSKKCLIVSGVVAGIILLLTAGYVGVTIGEKREKEANDKATIELLEKVRVDHESLVVSNNNVKSLQEALAKSNVKLDELADLILEIPGKVKYITVVEKVFIPVEGPERLISFDNFNDDVFFSFEGGETINPDGTKSKGNLVVGSAHPLDKNNDGIKDSALFKNYKLKFNLVEVHGEDKTSFLLKASSEYNNVVYDVKLDDAKVTKTTDEPVHKKVQPSLAMQIGAYAGANLLSKAPAIGYQAGISAPWLHPLKSLDILSPEIGIGQVFYDTKELEQFSFRGGINVISYNIGESDNSFLNDTWVGADVTMGTDGSLAGGLTIGTRL